MIGRTYPGLFPVQALTESNLTSTWQAGRMSTPADRSDRRDDERVEERAELLPEELVVGSDDPEAQAEAILADSDERVADPEGTAAESVQTTSSRPEPA